MCTNMAVHIEKFMLGLVGQAALKTQAGPLKVRYEMIFLWSMGSIENKSEFPVQF